MVAVLPRSFLDIDGVRVRVADSGPIEVGESGDRSGPPLLLIPGHTARIEGLDALVAHLPTTRRRVIVDLPGCGESDRPLRRYDLRFYEDVLLGVMDRLGIPAAVPVGGSLGGNLVLRLGFRAADRFPELVVWAPGSAWRARPRLGRAVSRLGRTAFWPSVWAQSRFWYDRDFEGRDRELAATFAYYRSIMSPGFVRMYWGIAGDQIKHSLFDIAPRITQRTLLLWGDRDHGAGMGAGVQRLSELLPECRLVVFPGVRHSIETEVPDMLGGAISTFLDS